MLPASRVGAECTLLKGVYSNTTEEAICNKVVHICDSVANTPIVR